MVEMLKLLNIYLNHFPKHEKYALANNIRRLIRKYSLQKFRRRLAANDRPAVVSILGHARQTDSLVHLVSLTKNQSSFDLPKYYRSIGA